MKLSKSNEDNTTTHEFRLGKRSVIMRFDNWCWDDGEIVAEVSVGKTVFNAGGVHIFCEDSAKLENERRTHLAISSPLILPSVKVGEITDIGEQQNGEIEQLCKAVGLNPNDSTHREEVDLAVRAASLTLARKLAEKRTSRSKRK